MNMDFNDATDVFSFYWAFNIAFSGDCLKI